MVTALEALRMTMGQMAPPQQQPVRNLQIQSGEPAAIMQGSQQQVQNFSQPSQPSVSQQFGPLLMDLLKKHQQLGTSGFAKQGFDAQAAQNARISAEAPSSLIGASPSLQASARSASAQALEPTISGARSAQQTFSEQLGSFRDSLTEARNYLKEIQAQEEATRGRAADIVSLAIEQGSAGLDALLRESPDIFKKAGYNTKEFEAVLKGLKAKEAEDARRFAITSVLSSEPTATQIKQQEKTEAKVELLKLLNQYREILSKSTAVSRFTDPSTFNNLNSLQSQITAVYKKQEQLGTLDAGVQMLIQGIIPGLGLNIGQLSTKAQVDALDNFIKNQGGIPGVSATSGTTSSGLKYTVTKP